jgi:hypothetical protein
MRTDWHRSLALMALCGVVVGCGGPNLEPVTGRVQLTDGDVSALADSNVEFVSTTDSNIRSYGAIESDGSFAMQTRHADGQSYFGVQEGNYKVRLILAGDFPSELIALPEQSDSDEAPDIDLRVRSRELQKLKLPVHVKFLNFETSGLTATVPTSGELVLTVSQK